MGMKWRTALVVTLQIAALLGMVGMKQWTLDTGIPVVLETAPVDPRSLFSGDYVRLHYTISTLRLGDLAGDKDFRRHDAVYVVLQQGTPYATPVSVQHAMPTAGAGQVVLRGDVEYMSDYVWNAQTRKSEPAKNISVHYGIESYYVQEGTGGTLERPEGHEKVSVRVAVDRNGQAGILAILLDGKERYEEHLL